MTFEHPQIGSCKQRPKGPKNSQTKDLIFMLQWYKSFGLGNQQKVHWSPWIV
jgi:hypothetical protein